MYVPAGVIVPDKVCVKNKYGWKRSQKNYVTFSSKVNDPPRGTIVVMNNIIKAPLVMAPIASGSNFYTLFDITHALPFQAIDEIMIAQMNYWALNDLIMSGCVGKSGVLDNEAELVVVTYGSNSTLLLKDGEIYKKITK